MDVFLSSTFEDLREHRAAVWARLEEAGFGVHGMEEFGTSGMPSLDTSFHELEKANVAVVLVGYRYGSVVPVQGVSYTEAEYERAHALGMKVFTYIRHGFDEGVRASEEPEGEKQALRAFRATIEADVVRGRTGFSDAQDLAEAVVQDLIRWASSDGRPSFQKPGRELRDLIAYAAKRTQRSQSQLLAPRIVLVDVGAADLPQTPGPQAGRLASKIWIIKRELEIQGHQAIIFTDLPASDSAPESRLEQRLALIKAGSPLLVCFVKDANDVNVLNRFADAGIDRVIWFRDTAPNQTVAAWVARQFDSDMLRDCGVANDTEGLVDDYITNVVLRAIGSGAA